MHSHEYGLRGSPISAPDRTPLSRWSRSGSHPDLTDRLVAVKAARGRPSPVTRECSAPHGSPHLRGVPWDVERLCHGPAIAAVVSMWASKTRADRGGQGPEARTIHGP